MIGKIKELGKDRLVKGSIMLFVMVGIFNLFNYVFQMSMARMLGPADYGILAVLMSIIYILCIPNEAIQTIISRYASKFEIRKEEGKHKDLLYRSMKKAIKISFGVFCLFLVVSIFISRILKIDFLMLGLTGLIIFHVFTIPVIRGILQGKKKFLSLGASMITESLGKVIFSIALVVIGFQVFGAVIGLLMGASAALLMSFFSIKEVISSKREKSEFSGIYRYNLPVLIGITSIVLIYSIDVIAARIFFTGEIAGKYAFVSLIGKIILFSSFAISKAMFPLSSENFERGKDTQQLLRKSLWMIFAFSIAMLSLCFFFPEQVIKIISLGSSQYTDAANVLFPLCLAFSFTAAANIIITYSLSINKMRKSSIALLGFVGLEAVLLAVFHSSLLSFSVSLLIVNFLMFIYSVFFVKK